MVASPTAPASQYAGSTRSLSIVPSRTSPSSNISFKLGPLPPLYFVRSTSGSLLGQPLLDQQSLSRSVSTPATQPMGPPPPPPRRSTVAQPSLSQSQLADSAQITDLPVPSRPFTVDKPVSSSSSSNAPLRSLAESAWEGREGEDILVEARLERYRSRGPRSQDPDEMRQCDFKIFELMSDRYNIPTRRITIRSCEREEQCISYCETR